MIVLDTNVVSRIMRRDPGVLAHLRTLRPGNLSLTSPVAAEIHYGLKCLPIRSKRRQLLEQEFERLRSAIGWVDWTADAALAFGRQKALLRSAGALIEDMDLAIAAIALSTKATLATLNTKHFVRIKELIVDYWTPYVTDKSQR